ncbi:MAG: glycosyltransferase family 39 protein [Methylophilaceae bacterium]|nr:glycosyltransferase family 39 protein [Methylophilaceae bacterium]
MRPRIKTDIVEPAKTFFVVLTVLLLALLLGLGERPVYKIQEVRIAETAREMLVSGDWLVPRYNGELRLQKPPLPYWLTAASYQIAGINAAATRLPAVLFGLLTALLVWNWVRRESGLAVAAHSVLILVISYIGLRYFRSGEADALLLFFVCAASMLGYYMLNGQSSHGRKLLFGLMLGLGFMTKGPAALAIPLLTLFVMNVIEKHRIGLSFSSQRFFSLAGVGLLVVTAFGWYAWILWQYPEASLQFFTRQIDETFVSGTHAKPIWWYCAHLFEFYAPWSLLLIPAIWATYRNYHKEGMPSLVRFAWVWLGIVFILLTITVNKQMQYALLFAPPLAIILGHYSTLAQGRFVKINQIFYWILCCVGLGGSYFILSRALSFPDVFLLLLFPLIPLAIKRVLHENKVSASVLLVAGMSAMTYLSSETYLTREPRQTAVQTLMSEAVNYHPLYQLATNTIGDGALSFYAQRIVPPVSPSQLPQLLQQYPIVWVVGEDIPNMPHATVEIVRSIDQLKLFRIERKR